MLHESCRKVSPFVFFFAHTPLLTQTTKPPKKYEMILKDGSQWAVIDKFCYWTTGPINDRVDIYYTCTLNEVERRR